MTVEGMSAPLPPALHQKGRISLCLPVWEEAVSRCEKYLGPNQSKGSSLTSQSNETFICCTKQSIKTASKKPYLKGSIKIQQSKLFFKTNSCAIGL